MKPIIIRIKNFLIGLPVIRNIPAFNTVPEIITTKNLRFYKLGNLVFTLCLGIHSSWFFLFWWLNITPLIFLNAFSVMVYILAIIINRRGYYMTSAIIMLSEIIFHLCFAIYLIGWQACFQYYLLVIMLMPFLMPAGRWTLKSVLLACCLLAYLLMDFYLGRHVPVYTLSSGLLIYLSISNTVFSCTSMCISGGYFVLAMHETEALLEKKSEELLRSEKKATLGTLASNMAHEIQNPLNFVNNFAELNAGLLAELKAEIEKLPAGDDIKNHVEDLVQNSERIISNGKRAAAMIDVLQAEVRKM